MLLFVAQFSDVNSLTRFVRWISSWQPPELECFSFHFPTPFFFFPLSCSFIMVKIFNLFLLCSSRKGRDYISDTDPEVVHLQSTDHDSEIAKLQKELKKKKKKKQQSDYVLRMQKKMLMHPQSTDTISSISFFAYNELNQQPGFMHNNTEEVRLPCMEKHPAAATFT